MTQTLDPKTDRSLYLTAFSKGVDLDTFQKIPFVLADPGRMNR